MTLLAVAILVLAGLAVIGLIYRAGRGRRRGLEDVPPGLRPGYSDDQLERSVLQRYMAWGTVFTVFFAVFLPVYWFYESRRIQTATEGFFVSNVVQGEQLYTDFCAECHGPDGSGGAAPDPYNPEGSWPAPDLTNIAARYEDNPNITDLERYIYTTIERGRPGTPMPSWGAGFQGSLTDQQIEQITDWILASQTGETAEATSAADLTGEELYVQSCLRCHGENGQGRVGPSLVGVFERHSEQTVLAILQNGILMGAGTTMPPWQNGYMYPDGHYNEDALAKIMDYLAQIQPDQLPEGAGLYQTPGLQQDPGGAGSTAPEGTEPEGTEPEGTEPEGTEPEGTEPEGGQETEPEEGGTEA